MWGISRDFEGGGREEEWEVRYLWAVELIFFWGGDGVFLCPEAYGLPSFLPPIVSLPIISCHSMP